MLTVDVTGVTKVVSELTGKTPARMVRVSHKSPSVNFKAEFDDCKPMLVKCCSKNTVLAEVDHPLAMRVLAAKGGSDDFAVWCCSWIDGRERLFSGMSVDEVERFADDYESFRAAIARDEKLLPPRDYGQSHESLKPIHGDLNRHNVLFENGRVTGFLDYEEFRLGCPTEDFVRFVCTSAESHAFLTLMGIRRLLRNFGRLVEYTSYTEEEWILAVRGFEKTKYVKGKNALSRRWHSLLYRRLEACCRAHERTVE